MRRDLESSGQSNIKQIVILLAVAFVVTLGVVIGTRMSSDALAVLVGVIAGVAASIPTALLLMAVTRRREMPYRDRYEEAQRSSSPPVIVVTPGSMPQQLPPYANAYPYQSQMPPSNQRRQFRVMGYEDEQDASIEVEADGSSWR